MCHNNCDYWKITGYDEGRCTAKLGHEPCDDDEINGVDLTFTIKWVEIND